MRASTVGRWVARAVFAAALGLGLAVPVAANAGETGVGDAVAAAVVKPGVYQTFEFDWQ